MTGGGRRVGVGEGMARDLLQSLDAGAGPGDYARGVGFRLGGAVAEGGDRLGLAT